MYDYGTSKKYAICVVFSPPNGSKSVHFDNWWTIGDRINNLDKSVELEDCTVWFMDSA